MLRIIEHWSIRVLESMRLIKLLNICKMEEADNKARSRIVLCFKENLKQVSAPIF